MRPRTRPRPPVVEAVEAEPEIEMCRSCAQRPAWTGNRLPVCEPCFSLVSSTEKMEYWREMDRAIAAPNMQLAIRNARARLVRATRMVG